MLRSSRIRCRTVGALVALLLLGPTGCATQVARTLVAPDTRSSSIVLDQDRLQSDLMNLVDDLITSVADVYGNIETNTTDLRRKAFAQSQKIEIASGALDNAVNAHPIAGLMDTVVLVTLTRQFSEGNDMRDLLGDDQPAVVAMLKSQEATAWEVAERFLTNAQVDELHAAIEKWRTDNPQQRYVAHVRLIDFLDAIKSNNGAPARSGSIFSLLFIDPLAGIDPAVREVEQSRNAAERMFFYVQRMPLVLSWRVELQYEKMLGAPQIATALTNFSNMSDQSRRFVDTTGEFAKTIEEFRKGITTERTQAIDQFAVSINNASQTSIAQATTRISTERENAVNQISVVARAEQKILVDNMEAALDRSIERFTQRLLRIALITVGTLFGALILYRLFSWVLPVRVRSIDVERVED